MHNVSSSSDYLYRLARSTKSEDREALAKSVTNLLQADLTKGEMILVQDILLRMLREAESDLRRNLAIHLSAEDKCPTVLVEYLMKECSFDEAEPLIRYSVAVNDNLLIETGKRYERPEYWRAMASRKKISRELALYLIHTKDLETQKILVGNEGADLCTLCMKLLTDIAISTGIGDLQGPLLQRSEITAELAARLYWHVSEKLKAEIQTRFNIDKKTLDQAVNYVVDKRLTQRGSVRTISMEMLGLVRKMPYISTRQIMDALQSGDRALFACLCGVQLKINPEEVLVHLEYNVVHTMAVLCRALNMTRTEFNSAYVMWRRDDPNSHAIGAMEMVEANEVFNRMKRDQAKTVIQDWAGLDAA